MHFLHHHQLSTCMISYYAFCGCCESCGKQTCCSGACTSIWLYMQNCIQVVFAQLPIQPSIKTDERLLTCWPRHAPSFLRPTHHMFSLPPHRLYQALSAVHSSATAYHCTTHPSEGTMTVNGDLLATLPSHPATAVLAELTGRLPCISSGPACCCHVLTVERRGVLQYLANVVEVVVPE